MKKQLKYNYIKKSLLMFALLQVNSIFSQMDIESVSDDWKQQTANYVVIGYTTDNPDDYIWEQKANQLQGVHIYVNASEIVPIYIQLNNNVINFSTRSGYDFAYTFMTRVKISVNNSDYVEIYSGSSKQDVVWYNSSNAFQTLGNHSLKVNIVDEFGRAYNREYIIKVIPSSDELYKDNYGNTLRVWKGNNTSNVTPVVFSEGFDAYDTNPQEMYYFAAQDLIDCMYKNGFDVFLLDNKFGTQDIRNNAAGFSAAVRYVSYLYNDIPVIAGGVSMGGMIARYAFAKEEGDGNPLPASVFISVDSPQQGAVISKPLQDYKKENQAGDGFAEHALNNDAAKQLLNYCTYDSSGEIHTAFYAELNALNGDGYPHLTKNIGISFSTNQPNPNSGEWLNIEWFIPIPGEETFELTNEEKQPGSYLPVDLTTTDPIVMIASYWWVQFVLPPLQPLYYPTVYFNRLKDPAYIPYTSALDIVNTHSKFDVTIEPDRTTHHDILPPEIIEPTVTELLLTDKYIQNTNINSDYNMIGSSVSVGYKVTNDIPFGDVVIQNSANVFILASKSIVLKEGVEINYGASARLLIDSEYNSSCGRSILSVPVSQNVNPDYEEIIQNYPNDDFKVLSRSFSDDLMANNEFVISPNPCSNAFQILPGNAEIQHIKLIDIFGKIVLNNFNVNKNSAQIDVSSYPSGLYFVFIHTDGGEFVKKILIQ